MEKIISDEFANPFSEEIWRITYKYKDEQTINDTFKRVSKNIASIEKNKEEYEEKFFDLLSNFKFVPGGRILANAGTHYKGTTYINCFVGPLPEEDIDSLDGILKILRDQSQTLKSEGGWGMNFSFIRPRGSLIKSIGVETPGAVKYMELFDKSSDIITSGSNVEKINKNNKIKIRKGAQMGILSLWHPDIEEFIIAKRNFGRLTKFNISVACYDDFMDKVIEIEELKFKNKEIPEKLNKWELVFPDTTHESYKKEWFGDIYDWKSKNYPVIVYKTITVEYLWNLIMDSTYKYNDPGILFFDRANKTHLWNYGGRKSKILACNPCQPSWVKILTENGIRQLKDVNIGDEIWSETGWVKIINKCSSGIKKVYCYRTTSGAFYGTENHKLVSNDEKVEAKDCESIDIFTGEYKSDILLNVQDVMDGIVIGDGSVHKASNNLVHLCIGGDDYDYFTSEIKDLVIKHRPGLHDYAYEVKTTIIDKELPKTYNRSVPDRFLYGDRNKVAGFLRGLFTANGGICGDRIALKATSFKIIEQVQIMLSFLGIRSYYTTNKPSAIQFSNGEYTNRQSYNVNITSDRDKFYAIIGFIQEYKTEELLKIINGKYRSSLARKRIKNNYDIISVDFISEEEVFNITVDNDSHTYWTQGCNVSNCGEQMLPFGGCCNLGSLNLTQFIDVEKKEFDFNKLEKYTKLGIRFLDNVNDLSNTPLEEYKWSMKNLRRVGLGVMGWGSSLYLLGIRFSSKDACDLQDKIMSTICYSAIDYSVDLAIEKGKFYECDIEKHYKSYYFDQINLPNKIRDKIKKYGMRNSALFSIQPNGNTSCLANNITGGIEPIFANEYIRTMIVQTPPEYIRNKCPKYWEGEFIETEMFKFTKEGEDRILKGKDEFGIVYKIDKNRGLTKEVLCEDYSVDKLKKLNKWDSKNKYVITAEQLTVEDHINDIKGFAKWIDSAISKTVNIPNEYFFEDFKKIYLDSYKTGYIKGITTYRAGTTLNVLSSGNKDNVRIAAKRPENLESEIHHFVLNKQRYYVVIGLLENREPYEVFTGINSDDNGDVVIPKQVILGSVKKIGKGKYILISDNKEFILTNGHSDDSTDALTRMISCAIRHKTPLHFIIEQLLKTKGPMFSFSKLLARTIKKYIKDGIESTEKCPECGGKLIFVEGCKKCTSCNFAGCS